MIERIIKKIRDLLSSIRIKKFNTESLSDNNYKEYIKAQMNRSISRKHTNPEKIVKYLLTKLFEKDNISKDIKIISIGCRNINEIKAIESFGFKNIIGIDLYSENKSILIMDMHDIQFPENSFDLIYSSHSLEHSINPSKAISEFVRVAKDNAYFIIEVPVNFNMCGADLINFESLENLYSLIKKHVYIKRILFDEALPLGALNNFEGTDIIRTIFQIDKHNK